MTLPERLLGALPPRSTMALITTPNLQSPSLQVPRDTSVAAGNTSSTARVQNTQEWLDSIVTGCDAVQVCMHVSQTHVQGPCVQKEQCCLEQGFRPFLF